MKYILATSYDVFGYLIPGIIATLGLCLLSGVAGPFDAADWTAVTATGWTVILFACYIVGLLLQSGYDLISRILGSRGEDAVIDNDDFIDPELRDTAYQRVFAVIPGARTTRLWRLCETIVQLQGKSDTLDIYIYREGLYRGLMGATALLCAGLGRQLLSGDAPAVRLGPLDMELGRMALSSVAIAALLGCIGCFHRYRKFCAYRVRYSLCYVAFYSKLTAAQSQRRQTCDAAVADVTTQVKISGAEHHRFPRAPKEQP